MRSENPFTESIVYQMLHNEVYVGDRLLQKEAPANYLTKRPDKTEPYKSYYVTNAHEGIVKRDTWNRVITRIDADKADRTERVFKRENTHFLYGIVFCGECGAPYKRRTVKGKKVWRCGDRINGAKGSGCKNRSVSEEELLRAIYDQLGLVWEAVDQFNVETLQERVSRVEIRGLGVLINANLGAP
jgi:site-specific DNA recombinase